MRVVGEREVGCERDGAASRGNGLAGLVEVRQAEREQRVRVGIFGLAGQCLSRRRHDARPVAMSREGEGSLGRRRHD